MLLPCRVAPALWPLRERERKGLFTSSQSAGVITAKTPFYGQPGMRGSGKLRLYIDSTSAIKQTSMFFTRLVYFFLMSQSHLSLIGVKSYIKVHYDM